MHYVYLLQSQKDGTFYVGSTGDLKRRFYQHNQSQSTATKAKVPWKLVYYEAYG
ncbi:GIY-YIG nuclease family protein, partial [Candidatus Saccharibacteria bacterium]|nr:GIY-YIG nuclease family protein [Candidatus Saccharibacteria bacterium]